MSARVLDGPVADGVGLDSLLEAHHDFVLRTALALAGNLHDAEDITQEALLAIVRGVDGFRGDAQLRTWIYRVTFRVGIRWLARNRQSAGEPSKEVVAPPPGLPLELVQAIGRLPLASRTVLMLVAIEGFSHGEAGAALGIPAGTVASRLHHARRQLRNQLDLSR